MDATKQKELHTVALDKTQTGKDACKELKRSTLSTANSIKRISFAWNQNSRTDPMIRF
jgi:hypothetical protein